MEKKMINKIALLTLTVMLFGFAGISQVSAAKGPCPDHCRMAKQNCPTEAMEARSEAHKKFMAETVDLRREMMVAKAKMQAVMKSEEPDVAKAGELAGTLFDLKKKLHIKRAEHGLAAFACGQCGKCGKGECMQCDCGCRMQNCAGNCGCM